MGWGEFKSLVMKNSDFSGTDFGNICLEGADLEGSNLRGADMASTVGSLIVLTDADIQGMYAGDNHIPDRRAVNYAMISRTRAELNQFRMQHLGMNVNNNVSNNNSNNNANDHATNPPAAANSPSPSPSLSLNLNLNRFYCE